MWKPLANTLAVVAVIALLGCGQVTTTDARQIFINGLNADNDFPCTLTRRTSDLRNLKMNCKEEPAADAHSALARVCSSFDTVGVQEIRLTAGDHKSKCVVADGCTCK
jgi:hypothetical protein